MSNIKIVTIGAGTGQANLLTALSQYNQLTITAIVGVTDNGGHSGVLRQKLNIPAVGDVRQCLVALSNKPMLREAYMHRDQDGYCTGNNFLARYIKNFGSLAKATSIAGQELGLNGHTVLPVTNASINIVARLVDGQEIIGEWEIIDRPSRGFIAELFLQPDTEALPECLLAIQESDYIIVGPGSLRTGIVSCLLPGGMRQVLRSTRAPIILVVNLMTHPGQTDEFTVMDHINEFARYADVYPSYVVINTGVVPDYLLQHYATIGSQPVQGEVTCPLIKVIQGDFIPPHNDLLIRQERVGDFKKMTHALVHDGKKLGATIFKIINGC